MVLIYISVLFSDFEHLLGFFFKIGYTCILFKKKKKPCTQVLKEKRSLSTFIFFPKNNLSCQFLVYSQRFCGNIHIWVICICLFFYMEIKILPSLVLHVSFSLSQKYILETISYQCLEQLHFKMNTPYAYLISLTSSWVICFHDTFILNNERVSILLSKVFEKIFLPETLSFHCLKEEFRIKMLGQKGEFNFPHIHPSPLFGSLSLLKFRAWFLLLI